MPTLAFAMCGSFCTFEKALAQLALLRKDWDMLPVMSETAYTTDTRFGTAESFHERIENICGRKIIHTIAEAEPIGPKRLADAVPAHARRQWWPEYHLRTPDGSYTGSHRP